MLPIFECVSCQTAILNPVLHYSFCPPDCDSSASRFCHHHCEKCLQQQPDLCDPTLLADSVFSDIKRQIDIRREQLSDAINQYSQQLFDDLEKARRNPATQKICKNNFVLTRSNLASLDLPELFGVVKFDDKPCKPLTVYGKIDYRYSCAGQMLFDDRGLLYVLMGCVIYVCDPKVSCRRPKIILSDHDHAGVRPNFCSTGFGWCKLESISQIVIKGDLLASAGPYVVSLWCTLSHTNIREFRASPLANFELLAFSDNGLLAVSDIEKKIYV